MAEVAITATEIGISYRFDVTAPADTQRVTLYEDGVRSGRADTAPPWTFTRTWDSRIKTIVEAKIEGPFGELSAVITVPEQPPPPTRNVHLSWDASPDPLVKGYRGKAGPASGQYRVEQEFGNVLDGMMAIPREWLTAYFCIVAYNEANQETPSTELVMTWAS